MIDWNETESQFDITSDSVKSRSIVVVVCEQCNVKSHMKYDSYIRKIRRSGGCLCHDCATKSNKFRSGCSDRAKSKWQEQEYQYNNLAAVRSDEYRVSKAEFARKMWQDLELRPKLLANSRATIAKANAASRLIWSEQDRATQRSDIRERLRAKSNEQWQDADLRRLVSVASKSRWLSEEYRRAVLSGIAVWWSKRANREKMADLRAQQAGRLSYIQQLLYKHLRDLGADFEEEGQQTRIGYYNWDCLVRRTSRKPLLIDCQGDYWHSLPSTKARDAAKFTYISRYFPEYEVAYFWEHEFYTANRVPERLKIYLGLRETIIDFDFSQLKIADPPALDIRQFLDAYHYIGKGRGGIAIGAYLGSDLVACAIFSRPSRQNQPYALELSRFCIHPCYQKKNFASWFLAKCLRRISERPVVSYADTTVGHSGVIYKAAGFRLDHEVKPDYWYVDIDGHVMHKQTLYKRAIKMKLTERQFAKENGYEKRWGSQKLCFVKD